jgi:ABC-type multidrug transport system fused ATPase/permease subunit
VLVVKACAREEAEMAAFSAQIDAAHQPRLKVERMNAAFAQLSLATSGIGAAVVLSERVSAVRVVRSFAQEEAEVAELDGRIDAHRARSWASMRVGALQGALAFLLSGAGTVAVLAYGAVLIVGRQLSVGELLAFYALLAQLYNPIVRLTQFHGMAAGTVVAVDWILEVFDEPETLTARTPGRSGSRAGPWRSAR